jgi:hypothetical protein
MHKKRKTITTVFTSAPSASGGIFPSALQGFRDLDLFRRFGHGLFCRLEANLGMRSIAERLFRRCPATAQGHAWLGRILVPISVLQLNRPGHDVGAVFDYLNSYFSHSRLFLTNSGRGQMASLLSPVIPNEMRNPTTRGRSLRPVSVALSINQFLLLRMESAR